MGYKSQGDIFLTIVRNYCPSHCRSVDATNHPKHTEPAQVFTSFLPSKHFRKIGEDCWHSSTNPKRRHRSWIKRDSRSYFKFEQAQSCSNWKSKLQVGCIGEYLRKLLPVCNFSQISLKALCTTCCIQWFKGIVNMLVAWTETSTKCLLLPFQKSCNHGSLLTSVKIHCF